MGRTREIGGVSASPTRVLKNVLGFAPGPSSRPQTLASQASRGGWPYAWLILSALSSWCPCLPPGPLPVWGAESSDCWWHQSPLPRWPGPLLAPVLGAGAPGSVSLGVRTRPGGAQQALPPPGCPKGFYGKQCHKKCHCANRGRCHRLYGACLCDPGLYGRFCHLGESPPRLSLPEGVAACSFRALLPTLGLQGRTRGRENPLLGCGVLPGAAGSEPCPLDCAGFRVPPHTSRPQPGWWAGCLVGRGWPPSE